MPKDRPYSESRPETASPEDMNSDTFFQGTYPSRPTKVGEAMNLRVESFSKPDQKTFTGNKPPQTKGGGKVVAKG